MLETLKIAFVSTVLGMLISMPLALLSNRNQNPDWIALPVRLMLAGARTLPSIIWAILFVILIGLGPLAGILAMTVYTVGYLGKLQYEAMEGVARPRSRPCMRWVRAGSSDPSLWCSQRPPMLSSHRPSSCSSTTFDMVR